MVVRICDGLHFSKTSFSIYHKQQSDMCVYSWSSEFAWALHINFQAL